MFKCICVFVQLIAVGWCWILTILQRASDAHLPRSTSDYRIAVKWAEHCPVNKDQVVCLIEEFCLSVFLTEEKPHSLSSRALESDNPADHHITTSVPEFYFVSQKPQNIMFSTWKPSHLDFSNYDVKASCIWHITWPQIWQDYRICLFQKWGPLRDVALFPSPILWKMYLPNVFYQ